MLYRKMMNSIGRKTIGRVRRYFHMTSTSLSTKRPLGGKQYISVINPTDTLHIGHHLGWMRRIADLQNSGYDMNICINDTLALTRLQEPVAMKSSVLKTTALLMACGVDPLKTLVFQSSQVPNLALLEWCLNCAIDKDDPKFLLTEKTPSLARYVEPLMKVSASMLFSYEAKPVITSDEEDFTLVKRWMKSLNTAHKLKLRLPVHEAAEVYIRNLRNPALKMTSNVTDVKSFIALTDEPDVVIEKCKKAITDFTSEVYFDEENRPGVSNLMTIHSKISGKSLSTIKDESIGLETAEYKIVVANEINVFLAEIQQNYKILVQNEDILTDLLKYGSQQASLKSAETLYHINYGHGIKYNFNTPVCEQEQWEETQVFKTPGKKTIFSGIQPTGVLHLGNYSGAVKQWVAHQEAGDDVTISIVDQHAITVPQTATLQQDVLTMAACVMACGVDPEVSCLYQQSDVPQHAQLYAVLRGMLQMATLAGQAHYKDKVTSLEHAPSLGLFSYPVLQAADILLFMSSHVPVGDDQRQHLQLTLSIAQRFNKLFGKTFYTPKPIIMSDQSLSRVKSLCQPNKKMSKSEANPDSRIEMTDSTDDIVRKIQNAVVACSEAVSLSSVAQTTADEEVDAPAGVGSLLAMHSMVTNTPVATLLLEYGALTVRDYKRVVTEAMVVHVTPVSTKIHLLLEDRGALQLTLDRGAAVARARAQRVLDDVHSKVGFV